MRLEVSYNITKNTFINLNYYFIEAKFVNPKIVTNVPGPGAHEANDIYTTREHSKQFWSMCRVDKNKAAKPVKHPGPQEYNIPSKIVEKPEYQFGLRPPIDP